MTHDKDGQERKLVTAAMDEVKRIANGRPCMVIIGFDVPGGMKVCSASNLSTEHQFEMMNILIEGFSEVPENTTFN
jgi:hypothetical protein